MHVSHTASQDNLERGRTVTPYLCGGHALGLDNACHVLIFIHHLHARQQVSDEHKPCKQQDHTLLLYSLI